MSKDSLIPPTPNMAEYNTEAASALIPDVIDPILLFREWLADANINEPNDANAMSLATVDDMGMPDVRIVLLKDVSADGFTFYTHATSAKGRQVLAHEKAALCFHWKSLRRQVRIRGNVRLEPVEKADAYFASRARISRLGAWASDQSQPLATRADLEERLAKAQDRFGDNGPVPRPEQWKGFAVVPQSIEFWQDQPFRLHDRLVFERVGEEWSQRRLYP